MKNLKFILIIAVFTFACEQEDITEDMFDLSLIPGMYIGKSHECIYFTSDYNRDSSDYQISFGGGVICRQISSETAWLPNTTIPLSDGEYPAEISSLGDNKYLLKFNHSDTTFPTEMLVKVSEFYTNNYYYAYCNVEGSELHYSTGPISEYTRYVSNEDSNPHFKYTSHPSGNYTVYYSFDVLSKTDPDLTWTFSGHKRVYEEDLVD